MKPRLFLLFNHSITPPQETDARNFLGIGEIVPPADDLLALWRHVPPDLPKIGRFLSPVRDWLSRQAREGDYVLIQGDFGACYLMVRFAFEMGCIPIYSTTEREAVETHAEDGSVTLTHRFEHRIFREYGK